MIITLPYSHAGHSGPRPIDLRRDAHQVLQLLDVAFGRSLDPEKRRSLHRSLALVNQSWYQFQFTGPESVSPGFVWEENGRIVGNVSIMTTRQRGRYLIANVAVHPGWRRQGIARRLMAAALQHLASRRGQTALLQVQEDAVAAQALYARLGFARVGVLTSWASHQSRLRPLPATGHEPAIQPLRRHQWREAYTLDCTSMHPDLNWPDPLPADRYKSGWWRWLANLINGRQAEHWVTLDQHHHLTALASITSEWHQTRSLSLRVAPAYRGQLERPLLAKVLRRLTYLPQRRVSIDHPADDALMNQLLKEANFQARRTLVVMRYDLST